MQNHKKAPHPPHPLSAPRRLSLLTIISLVCLAAGCNEAPNRASSSMDELEAALAGPYQQQACIDYRSLCERADTICSALNAASAAQSGCAERHERCVANLERYCAAGSVPVPDAAGSAQQDATTTPQPDAALPLPDAQPPADSAQPPADSAQPPADSAQPPLVSGSAVLVRTIDTSSFAPVCPDPAGVVYLAHRGELLVTDSEVEEMSQYFAGANAFYLSLAGAVTGTFSTLPFSYEPTGVGYNPQNLHLFFSDDDQARVFELAPGFDKTYLTDDDVVTSFKTSAFGSTDPEGVTYDSWRDHLFVVDGEGTEVFDVAPGANGIFDGVAPAGDDQVSHFDTSQLGAADPEGIAFNDELGHLYILSGLRRLVVETTLQGSVVRKIDVGVVQSTTLAGIAYAPASDGSGTSHLFIVDRRQDNNAVPDENDGRLYELRLP